MGTKTAYAAENFILSDHIGSMQLETAYAAENAGQYITGSLRKLETAYAAENRSVDAVGAVHQLETAYAAENCPLNSTFLFSINSLIVTSEAKECFSAILKLPLNSIT